jgi:phosphocarrier protein FPr/phosphocarrier protein
LKLTLVDALHARPANLFVRVAATFVAVIEIRRGERRADAKNILEVLTLGAAKGDTVDIEASGDDAEAALAALTVLVERNFDAGLVSETGAAAVAGIAVGPALVLDDDEATSPGGDSGARSAPLTDGLELDASARAAMAFAQVRRDLEAMVRALPVAEGVLFEPEIAIVKALDGPVRARVHRGQGFEQALAEEVMAGRGEAQAGTTAQSDLIVDARERLLDAYAGETQSGLAERLAEGPPGDVVLVTRELTPSLVAALPRRVTGIVAASDDLQTAGGGYASHAAILARGRGIPLLFVAPHVVPAIAQGDIIVLDARTSPPELWTSPSAARVAEAEAAVADERRRRRELESQAKAPLAHLPSWGGAPFAICVNIGTVHDYVPAGSDGVGLVRTELLHAPRARVPTLDEELAILALVAGKVGSGQVVVRLFDGGGDKPIAWLPAPADAPGARGIELLFRHPDVLRTQVTAIARAGKAADVRLLIPLVGQPGDVERVRALAPAGLRIGAMIETPAAVRAARAIAEAADFVCIGTNDLTALVRGEDRATAAAAPLDAGVLALVADVVDAAHRAGRAVTVCGEMAGEPDGALILVGLGVDAISVAPSRLAIVRSALAAASPESSRAAARAAMGKKGTVS